MIVHYDSPPLSRILGIIGGDRWIYRTPCRNLFPRRSRECQREDPSQHRRHELLWRIVKSLQQTSHSPTLSFPILHHLSLKYSVTAYPRSALPHRHLPRRMCCLEQPQSYRCFDRSSTLCR